MKIEQGRLKIALPLWHDGSSVKINSAYVEYINGAGFIPVGVLPSQDHIESYASMCNGLLLPGGVDIDPMFYGVDNASSYAVDPERDSFERALLKHFINAGKPIFGICRGLQLIAYEFIDLCGRKLPREEAPPIELRQHISGHDKNTSLRTARGVPTHFVTVNRRLLYGEDTDEWSRLAVNSMHHQYVHCYTSEAKLKTRLFDNRYFKVTAFTREGLGPKEVGVVVEGFYIPVWKAAAVQWHPEELQHTAVLQQFFLRYTDVPREGHIICKIDGQ